MSHNPEFFHYKGSLTIPPCLEAVNWHVFKQEIPIGKSVMDFFRQQFRTSAFFNGKGDFRIPMPVNQRRVYQSNVGGYLNFDKAVGSNAGIWFSLGLFVVGLLAILFCFFACKENDGYLPTSQVPPSINENDVTTNQSGREGSYPDPYDQRADMSEKSEVSSKVVERIAMN
jgi:hypothetical protein